MVLALDLGRASYILALSLRLLSLSSGTRLRPPLQGPGCEVDSSLVAHSGYGSESIHACSQLLAGRPCGRRHRGKDAFAFTVRERQDKSSEIESMMGFLDSPVSGTLPKAPTATIGVEFATRPCAAELHCCPLAFHRANPDYRKAPFHWLWVER